MSRGPKTFIFLAVTAALATAVATTASGHGLNRSPAQVWGDANRCLKQTISTRHGDSGSGLFGSEARARKRGKANTSCSRAWFKDAAGLRTRLLVLKKLKDGSAGVCVDTGWRINDRRAQDWGVTVAGPPSGRPWCGRGRYKSVGRSSVKRDGRWRGGSMATRRWHHLPVPSTSSVPGKKGAGVRGRTDVRAFLRNAPLLDCVGEIVARTNGSRAGPHVPCEEAGSHISSG